MVLFSYILACEGLKINDLVLTTKKKWMKKFSFLNFLIGNVNILRNIPTGTFFFNLQIRKNFGGQFLRSSGAFGQIVRFFSEDETCLVKLRSEC